MDNLELKITALGMRNHDGYSVVALEMDLWGFGDTEEEALEEMIESVRMQVSFAMHIKDFSLLDVPAPKKYQDMYRDCRVAYVQQESADSGVFVRSLPLPVPQGCGMQYATA